MQTNNINFFSSYGKALKSYIKEEGIKQSYIAKKTGKGKDEISNYVNDKVMPNEESQQKIEQLLGISITEEHPNQWVLRPGRSQISEPEVAYADEVDLPKGGKLSAGQMKTLLSQIESICQILKDSL